VAALRAYGIRSVVVVKDLAVGTPWEDAATRPLDELDIEREEGRDVVVFDLGS